MRHTGASVVEIVGVIALLGLFAVAAIVLVPSGGPARLDAAVKQVQSDIQHARQLAMTTGAVHGAQFVANGIYTVYRQTIATPVASPLTRQDMVITLGSNYPGVAIQNNYTVEFDSNGAPIVGGGSSVIISNTSASKSVLVRANTGSVVIQ